jgi:hypothetical protein
MELNLNFIKIPTSYVINLSILVNQGQAQIEVSWSFSRMKEIFSEAVPLTDLQTPVKHTSTLSPKAAFVKWKNQ